MDLTIEEEETAEAGGNAEVPETAVAGGDAEVPETAVAGGDASAGFDEAGGQFLASY